MGQAFSNKLNCPLATCYQGYQTDPAPVAKLPAPHHRVQKGDTHMHAHFPLTATLFLFLPPVLACFLGHVPSLAWSLRLPAKEKKQRMSTAGGQFRCLM